MKTVHFQPNYGNGNVDFDHLRNRNCIISVTTVKIKNFETVYMSVDQHVF